MFKLLVILLTNKNFYNLIKIFIVVLPICLIVIFFIYKNITIKHIVNDVVNLKFNNYIDSVLIFKQNNLFEGYVLEYYNTYNEEDIKTYITLNKIIVSLKAKGYNDYLVVSIPMSNLYVIMFWYNKPNEKVNIKVKNEVDKINNIFNFKYIFNNI